MLIDVQPLLLPYVQVSLVKAYKADKSGAKQFVGEDAIDRFDARILDLQGILGLSREVRNGYQQIRVSFRIDADASPAARPRSASARV